MEEIKKKEIDDNVAVDTDAGAEQRFNKLKKCVTIDEPTLAFKPSAKKHWTDAAYDAAKFKARTDLMTRIAQNTCNMIRMYFMCAEANDPIISKKYIKIVKDNIEFFLKYYTDFESVKKKYPAFFDLALGDTKNRAIRYADHALKDALDFMEYIKAAQ